MRSTIRAAVRTIRIWRSVCSQRWVLDSIMHGDPLAPLEVETARLLELVRQTGFSFAIDLMTLRRQYMRSMRGLTRRFGEYDDDEFDHVTFLSRVRSTRSTYFDTMMLVLRINAACYADQPIDGLKAGRLLESRLDDIQGLTCEHEFYLYDSLCATAVFEAMTPSDRDRQRRRLDRHERQRCRPLRSRIGPIHDVRPKRLRSAVAEPQPRHRGVG